MHITTFFTDILFSFFTAGCLLVIRAFLISSVCNRWYDSAIEWVKFAYSNKHEQLIRHKSDIFRTKDRFVIAAGHITMSYFLFFFIVLSLQIVFITQYEPETLMILKFVLIGITTAHILLHYINAHIFSKYLKRFK